MFTLLYSIGKVNGAEVVLAGYFACLAVFALAYFLKKRNRTPRRKKRGIIGFAACELICDIIWFLYFFPGGEYYNHGLSGAFLFFLWPALLYVLLL